MNSGEESLVADVSRIAGGFDPALDSGFFGFTSRFLVGVFFDTRDDECFVVVSFVFTDTFLTPAMVCCNEEGAPYGKMKQPKHKNLLSYGIPLDHLG
jgi:hypothetical protein